MRQRPPRAAGAAFPLLAGAALMALTLAGCATGGSAVGSPPGGATAAGAGTATAADRGAATTQARPRPSAPPGSAAAGVTERILPNGLKLLIKEDHRAPTAVHMVWYRAGSIDETNGRTGVAHLLEHMMFKGTKAVPGGEFSRRVAQAGGRENAFTSRDYTGYYQQVPKARLAEMMALEADRMTNLIVSKEEFEREIKVVMEERRLRTEDRAQALVYEQLMATAFVASPVRTPVVGWMNDLEQMTWEDARDWYQAWYAPDNAVVIVVGDVDPAEVIRTAERTYGQIAARPLPHRKAQEEPRQRGVRRVSVKAPAENPYVLIGLRVPRLADLERDRDVYALEVLSAVLSADENGRFVREIVRGSRTANQASAGYDMTSRGPTLFLLSGVPADGKTTADVERAMLAQIARIAREGVGENELRRVKTQYVASQVYSRDSMMAQAQEMAGMEMSGFSYADIDRLLEQVRSVTSDEIRAVAGKYFGEDAMTVVTLLPQPVAARRPAAAPARHD